MPTVDVSRDFVEYTGERLYHVKVNYDYHDSDDLDKEIHEWVKTNFTEYECDTLTPGYWYIAIDPAAFVLAFKLCWGDVRAEKSKRNI